MFDHRHYVPVLKGKTAEYGALKKLHSHAAITPLIEAVPTRDPVSIVKDMGAAWGSRDPYFVDFYYFDDEDLEVKAAANHPLSICFSEVLQERHLAIPVTGTSRSPAYQTALATITASQHAGFALRLVPDDFEDEQELPSVIDSLLELTKARPSEVDLIIDEGTVQGEAASIVAQIIRAKIEMVPRITEWRTLTVLSGAFPLGLAALVRSTWNRIPRNDWIGWTSLARSKRALPRRQAYGDYNVAHPDLPPEGRATVLAQLRYTAESDFLVWKGENAVKRGFDQFYSICEGAQRLPEFKGKDFMHNPREKSQASVLTEPAFRE